TKTVGDIPQQKTAYGIKMFLSSFAVGITNPTAIITFLFAFSYFGIVGNTGLKNGILLVIGIFIGTYIWWGILTAAVEIIKKKKTYSGFRYANKIFGAILIVFSIVIFAKNII
ncbi:MAG: LysE family transporter, partial [Oscillospiraceae bacterium]|nr:LysE family transporter [Oscillospiraceae bacterium]